MTTSKASSMASNKKAQRPSWIQQLMFIFSGVNIRILRECPTDWNKYAGIGATILFTGMLASLSGGYALYTIFRGGAHATQYAIGFGVLWGLVILNLDRFVVSSIKKEGNFKREIIQALPRFALAIVISVVIAKPLEVKIFESRITQQIQENKLNKLAEERILIDSINNIAGLTGQIGSIESEVAKLEQVKQSDPTTDAFAQLIADKNAADNELAKTRSKNNSLISKERKEIAEIKNNSSYYRPKFDENNNLIENVLTKQGQDLVAVRRRNINKYNGEINAIKRKITNLENNIAKAREEHRKETQQKIQDREQTLTETQRAKDVADSTARAQAEQGREIKEKAFTNNFITQLEAMEDLTKENRTLRNTSWMITLLFIVIEIAPILAKLLSHRGPYDDRLESYEHQISVKSKLDISEINLEINELLKGAEERAKLSNEAKTQNHKLQLDKDQDIYLKTIETVAEKQEDLAKIAINQWYEAEKQRLEQQNGIVKTLVLAGTSWEEKSDKKPAIYTFHQNGEFVISQASQNPIDKMFGKSTQRGKWKHDVSQQHLEIEVNDLKITYQVTHFSHNKLEIKKEEDSTTMVFENISYIAPQPK